MNLLFLDPRIELPPNLWAVTIFHELRPGFDEVITLNNLPEDKKSLVEFEIKGRIAGLLIWWVVKDDFLKTWTKKMRDYDPAYLNAKLMLFDLIRTEPLAEEYLNGQPKGLEKYLEERIWLPKE